jgi:hypothetical protein
MTSFPSSISHLKDFIEKTDDDGSLQIYSYSYCNNDSPYDLKDCRGLIYSGENLIFKSLGFTPEYTETNQDVLCKTPIENYQFFPAEEGTLIRVFFNSKWYFSTHRKLDAYKSRWGAAKSFGEIFEDSIKSSKWENLENLTNDLDKKYMYLFFIRNTIENKIVSNPPKHNKVYFVGSMSTETGKFSFKSPNSFDFPSQTPVYFEKWSDVFNYVKNVDPLEKQGILAFKEENGVTKQIKIVNSKYQLYSQVRGNEPNVNIRYLQVRSHPIYSKLIYELYPENINTFVNFEYIIVKIAKNIHNSYISRFVNKNYVVVSQEEYRIIRDCHGWHISDRAKNKVTLAQVIKFLNQDTYASTLNTLINRFMNNKK